MNTPLEKSVADVARRICGGWDENSKACAHCTKEAEDLIANFSTAREDAWQAVALNIAAGIPDGIVIFERVARAHGLDPVVRQPDNSARPA